MLWLALGCTEPFTGALLGDVAGTSDRVGVGVDAGAITILVVGADETLATDSRWFDGALADDGSFSLAAEGWTAVGTLAGDVLDGDLRDAEGGVRPFTAGPLDDASKRDGPWTGADGDGACRAGAVLFNAEFQVQGFYCPEDGAVVSVSSASLETSDGTIDLAADADPPIPFTATPAFPLPPAE